MLAQTFERIATKTMGESWGMSPTLHTPHTPAIIATLGERASYLLFEFFTGNIRIPNTRGARRDADHTAVESVRLAAYIEQLQKARSAPP